MTTKISWSASRIGSSACFGRPARAASAGRKMTYTVHVSANRNCTTARTRPMRCGISTGGRAAMVSGGPPPAAAPSVLHRRIVARIDRRREELLRLEIPELRDLRVARDDGVHQPAALALDLAHIDV